jgi:outer membrane protein insertion porin family
MAVHRTRSKARLAGALVLALLGLGVTLTIPEGPAAAAARAQGTEIEKVIVEGNQRVEASTVLSYLTIKPGDVANAANVDESLKALFATGLFADVQIERQGSDLLVKVVENPIINRVVFEGNKKLEEKDLTKEVQLRPRIVYTRARVQADVQRILELYRRSGRFGATVEPKIVQLAQNRVDLVFEINEGPVTGVRRITFIGNKHFSDRSLKEALATKESHWYSFLSSADTYDPDRLTYDRELLRRYYLSRGYADFRVVSAVAELAPDAKAFYITFSVEEGEQYRFGKVDVTTTLKALNPESLRPLLTVKGGTIYNVEQIDKSIDALVYAAGTKGYAFVDVRPHVQRHRDTRVIDLSFEINEGPRVYVERINVKGNTRTLDKVIRREFRLAEGDAYNRILVDRSKTRIKGLGFFKKVDINQEPGTAPDRTVLNVEVEEQSTGELSLGAGYSSTDSFIGDFSITERNLLGRGQFLRLQASLSKRRQQIDLRFTEPYFLDRNLAAGFDLFKTRTDFLNEAGYQTESTGATVRIGFPLTEFSRITPHYTLRYDRVQVDNSVCPSEANPALTDLGTIPSVSSLVCRSQGSTTSSLFGYDYVIDMRDDPIEPKSGWDFTLSQDLAALLGTERYLRTEVEANYFFPITWFGWDKVVTNLKASAGYIKGYDTKDVRLNDRFYKGSSTFRGFKTAGIGPRDTISGDSLGAEMYGIGTAAVSFPLGLPKEFGILGSLFTDFGTVGGLSGPKALGVRDDAALRVSVGFGLLWDSPFGPVRVDIAKAIVKESYDKTEFFRFSAGTRF